MTTDTERAVRSITVSPEFWADQPETAARLIAERMKEKPARRWVIVIGPAGSAEQFMESTQLFLYGPAEDPLENPG